MTIYLKQSTNSQEVPLGYFVDSTDGNTEKTGLTIANTDIKVWKNGATTLANKNSGGGTHISNGIYYAVLDSTDTDTLGPLVIFVHVATALAVRLECVVLVANVFDSLIGNTDLLQVDAEQFGNSAGTFSGGRAEVTLGSAALATVKTQMTDALNVDTYTEPGQRAPGNGETLSNKIGFLFKAWRNKVTQTNSLYQLFNDDAVTVDHKATVSDDGTTFTKGEVASGP